MQLVSILNKFNFSIKQLNIDKLELFCGFV